MPKEVKKTKKQLEEEASNIYINSRVKKGAR